MKKNKPQDILEKVFHNVLINEGMMLPIWGKLRLEFIIQNNVIKSYLVSIEKTEIVV